MDEEKKNIRFCSFPFFSVFLFFRFQKLSFRGLIKRDFLSMRLTTEVDWVVEYLNVSLNGSVALCHNELPKWRTVTHGVRHVSVYFFAFYVLFYCSSMLKIAFLQFRCWRLWAWTAFKSEHWWQMARGRWRRRDKGEAATVHWSICPTLPSPNILNL